VAISHVCVRLPLLILLLDHHPPLASFVMSCGNDSTGNDFLRLLKSCRWLTELHLKVGGFQNSMSKQFLQCILDAAPHLRRTLRVLSIAWIKIDPDAVVLLGEFQMLERLDMSNSFSTMHWTKSDDYDVDDKAIPFDEPLLQCVQSLKCLRRLDLGKGDLKKSKIFA
jgi:hypothetical protein